MAGFEKLDAYKKIAEFADFLQTLLPRIRKFSATLATQLQRSSESSELNLSEATKAQTPAMIIHYLRVSEGSCSEQKGGLKRAERIGAITKEERIKGELILNAASFFLIQLMRYWEDQL